MKPQIVIEIADQTFQIASYSLFIRLAAVAVIGISLIMARQSGLFIKSALLYFLTLAVSLLVGARLLNVLINLPYYMEHRDQILTWKMSGFSIMGGLIAAGLAGYYLAKKKGMSPWKMADIIAPGLAIGLAMTRIGCFLNGCCFGIETSSVFGVHYPYDSFPHRYYLSENPDAFEGGNLFTAFSSPALHPTPLYEMFGSLVAAALAVFLLRKKAPKGVAFLAASSVFVATRLINHFFRIHPSTNIISFWFYPSAYLLLLLVLLFLLVRQMKIKKGKKRKV